ncbi:LysR substrate-binding domain-containing protein [Oscillatoria sp. CS-180]|uniref:LysR substrate-binding domain-containing protein n=1 Tax=Oscillatoria sp. CS-180 TaxID=3021720 RepID=UPI00232C66C4|nr:LysR substrate-binding domain-containing protein [Oscillatoria sp. CS-180]MDB9526260.1 LysR substrate-binding domain-containing protein [Oscillatoria sp. CS-180]
MELRHLRYFVAVAEELHFGRAAARLHMAQQPLSRQIRQLELELDVSLFQRTKRTICLTEAGEAFWEEAQKTLRQAERAIAVAQRVSRGEAGSLQIGFTGPILNSVLPTIVRQFKARYPDIHLELNRLSTMEQIDALLNQNIQVGLLHPPIDAPSLTQEVIYQEPLIAAIPEGHPLCRYGSDSISVKALANEPFILFPRKVGPTLYDAIISFCQQSGFSPTVVQEAFPQQTILGLVASGLGISLIHASVERIQQRGVVTRSLKEITPQLESAIVWSPDTLHPALFKLLEVTRETVL